MYEINLVPDVKAELLKKRKIQSLVILGCVGVVVLCIGIVLTLAGTVGAQVITSAAKDSEIACRSTGEGNCNVNKFGTPVMQFENLNQLLTIQDQMKNLESLNAGKIRYSRVFGILDVLLLTESNPNPDDNNPPISISELKTDFNEGVSLSFEATATDKVNNIGFSVVEAFKKNATKIYYDYGSYMRKDTESGEFVEIPPFCIVKEESDGEIVYGTYVKGIPGCELAMTKPVEKTSDDDEDEEEGEDLEESRTEKEEPEEEVADIYSYLKSIGNQVDPSICEDGKDYGVECVKIRRTYIDENDKNFYKEGTDQLAGEGETTVSGYYFESKCIKYDENGMIDEDASLESCPLLSGEMSVGQPSQARDDDGNMVVSFDAVVPISRTIFEDRASHVMVLGPSRQNVTDSYVQIRSMFSSGGKER